jgi:hypothetical protein
MVMETLTATNCLTSLHAQAADPRASQPLMSTRAIQAGESQSYPPASQDSAITASTASDADSIPPRLHSVGSGLSQFSNCTEPSTLSSRSERLEYVKDSAQIPTYPQLSQGPHEGEHTTPIYLGRESAVTSPMSLASPVTTNGTKRTASGHIKTTSTASISLNSVITNGRSTRRDSTSSTGSRASELAASLRTRLSYAMAKVQHGWEHKSIGEVEQLATRKTSTHRHSISLVGRPTSRHGFGQSAPQYFIHEPYGSATHDSTTSPPSKRHSNSHVSHRRGLSLGQSIQLQPAADIRPTTGSRMHYYPPPPLKHASSMSPPRTPAQRQPRRPPTIRTETQTAEAERDALQALFQLGSPRTAQGTSFFPAASQSTSAQTSPLRSEFPTPRRVAFARSDSDNSSMRPSSSESSLQEARDRIMDRAERHDGAWSGR